MEIEKSKISKTPSRTHIKKGKKILFITAKIQTAKEYKEKYETVQGINISLTIKKSIFSNAFIVN